MDERMTCPACDETFAVPAFSDPDAGVVPIAPESDPTVSGDADAPESSQREEYEAAGQ